MRSWRYDENGHQTESWNWENKNQNWLFFSSSPFTRECNHSNLEAQIPTIRICSCFVVSCRGVAPKVPIIPRQSWRGSRKDLCPPSRQYNLKLTLDFYSLSGELIKRLFCVMLWYALQVATKLFDSADIISINNPSADVTLDSWVVPTTSSASSTYCMFNTIILSFVPPPWIEFVAVKSTVIICLTMMIQVFVSVPSILHERIRYCWNQPPISFLFLSTYH